jgi:Bacterial Ig-like domain (group 2)
MSSSWAKWHTLPVLFGLLLSSLSCGHKQQLVSITIEPDTETFGAANIPVSEDAGLSVQLRALGNYSHPPVTKDITDRVTWVSDTTDLVTVSDTGLLTATGISCGSGLVSATVRTDHSAGNISSSGAIVTGTMTANVVCFTSSAEPAPGHQ